MASDTSIEATKVTGYAVYIPPKDVSISATKVTGYAVYSPPAPPPPDPKKRRILLNTM